MIFDTDHNQLIQQFEDREVIHRDPIQQVNLQHYKFKQWLEENRLLKDILIYSCVVIANDKAKIIPKNNNGFLAKDVIRATKIRETVNNLFTRHKNEILLSKDLQKIRKWLIKQHTPSNPDLLNKLQIKKEELYTGVKCPRCLKLPIKRKYGKWVCPDCYSTSKDAYLTALRDYFLLINPSITTMELKDYLHLESRTTSQRLLSSLYLNHEGTTKNRIYHLNSH